MATSSISIDDQVKHIFSEHKIVVVQDNNQTCSWCIRAKQNLEKLNIPYTPFSPKTLAGRIHGASEDATLAAVVKIARGYDFVPMIFINGKFVGGCQQLEELIRGKKLMKLLHGESKL